MAEGCGSPVCLDCAGARIQQFICSRAAEVSEVIHAAPRAAEQRIALALDDLERRLPPPIAPVKEHFGHRFRYMPDSRRERLAPWRKGPRRWEPECFDCGCHYYNAHIATCSAPRG